MREPSNSARYHEQHREHVGGETHGLVDQPRVEVHIGVQLSLDEVIVRQRRLLERHCGIDLRGEENIKRGVCKMINHET